MIIAKTFAEAKKICDASAEAEGIRYGAKFFDNFTSYPYHIYSEHQNQFKLWNQLHKLDYVTGEKNSLRLAVLAQKNCLIQIEEIVNSRKAGEMRFIPENLIELYHLSKAVLAENKVK